MDRRTFVMGIALGVLADTFAAWAHQGGHNERRSDRTLAASC